MEQHTWPNDPRFQDLNGRKFGKLTVLFYAGRRAGKYSLWHCRCDCNREHTVVSSQLTLGQTKSCPHCSRHQPRKRKFEDLTGLVVGRLTVISFSRKGIRPGHIFWLCKCNCGELTVVRCDNLKSGKAQSCGCSNIVSLWRDAPKPPELICTGCNISKPSTLEFFYRHKSGRYGFHPRCKECKKSDHRKSHHKHYPKLREEILCHYGGKPPKCQCSGCDEKLYEFFGNLSKRK